MSDTTNAITSDADQIVANAKSALAMLDDQIEDRRRSKRDLGAEIAQLLEDRKPLARIVSAMEPRKPRTRKAVVQDNGDQQ